VRDVLSELERLLAAGEDVAVATVVSTRRSAPRPLGSRLLVTGSGALTGSVSGGCVESDVALRAREVLDGAGPRLLRYGISDDDAFEVGLPCGGEIEVFLERADPEQVRRVRASLDAGERLAVTTVVDGPDAGHKSYAEGEAHASARRESETVFVEHHAPPPVLMVFGAVDTAAALCRMARDVGFRTMVCDARARFATRERIPDADELVVGWPDRAYDLHAPDEATYVVVLNHDARFDEPAIGPALRSPAPYIGALGSRRVQEKRRRWLQNAGFGEADIARVSGPLGLDIGAATPAETAVAILAEVLAVRHGREGGRLSRRGPVAAPEAAA
jgi:xanthine dehydrogenase accessory factor